MKIVEWCVGSMLLASAFAVVGFAQTPSRGRPAVNARDPKPEDAIGAIIGAFNAFPIVATNGYAVSRFEQRHPGITFVVLPWIGHTQRDRCGLPVDLPPSAQSQMASWRVPSLVSVTSSYCVCLA
jgi:hypothetical protein